MRKKNGFISMSIVYSFFAVFTLVSTSLLLIYSNNIAIVKRINREIKSELNGKGNEALLVFNNLIVDGSFEDPSHNWVNVNTNLTAITNNYGILDYDDEQYYDQHALGFISYNLTETVDASKAKYFLVRSNEPISLKQNHYYYISRVYNAWNHIYGMRPDNTTKELYLYFRKKTGDTLGNTVFSTVRTPAQLFSNSSADVYDILANAKGINYPGNVGDADRLFRTSSIDYTRRRRESGFCIAINGRRRPKAGETSTGNYCQEGTYSNTLETGIFKFDKADGDYYLMIGADFSGWENVTNEFATTDNSGCDSTRCGRAPRYYTDGYMLFDLNVVFGLSTADWDTLFTSASTDVKNCRVQKINNLLDGRYIEGRKEIPAHRLDIKANCPQATYTERD